MPPKNKTKDSTEGTAANGETKFSWTPDNDRTLLLLSLGRNIGPADYEKFVSAMPTGANFQGVRQRITKLRAEQKKKYDEMGWELTSEASVKAHKANPKAPAASRKRKGSEESGDAEDAAAVKKPRARKGEGKKTVKQEEVDEGMGGAGGEEAGGDEASVSEASVMGASVQEEESEDL